MRVVDLDRDMSDVIPTGTSRDSEFLFERMTEATFDAACVSPGDRVLDVASGAGQDSLALADRGGRVVGAEPSARMIGMARIVADKHAQEAAGEGGAEARPAVDPFWVRAWGDCLPFADGSFDAAICKGALDHFDRPTRAIAEMSRVVRPGGRVVLAIANFEALGVRLARFFEERSAAAKRGEVAEGRRIYDVPSDHFTRYELDLMREQFEPYAELEEVVGVSLAWGTPGWSDWLGRLSEPNATRALQAADSVARAFPGLADVIVLAGRPRRSARTSS